MINNLFYRFSLLAIFLCGLFSISLAQTEDLKVDTAKVDSVKVVPPPSLLSPAVSPPPLPSVLPDTLVQDTTILKTDSLALDTIILKLDTLQVDTLFIEPSVEPMEPKLVPEPVVPDTVSAYDNSSKRSTRRPNRFRKGDASTSFWATQFGNVLSTGFVMDIAHGGFIGHDILDPVLEAHKGGMGFLGGSVGWEKKWSARPFKGGKWALCGSLGSELLYDARWTSDMFELIFYGNGGHTGRVDVLSGTGVRVAEFNRFGIGLENTNTRQRLEVSVVQRLAGAEWSIPYGYFWVSENADSLDTYLQTEARLHAVYDETDTTFRFLPAYGIGISGSLPLASETLPIRFEINFSDFGILFEPEGSSVAWFQEGIATTGLPVFGDSLTWESLIEGDISTDSLLLTGTSVSRMSLLPYRLSADIIYEPSPNVMIELGVASGGWMPEPLFTAGVGWMPTDRIAFGVQAKYGGWGKMRPAVWAQWRFSCRRMLVVEIEDPMGLFIGNELSDFTYNRGVTFRLERLSGNGWAAKGGRLKSTCKR